MPGQWQDAELLLLKPAGEWFSINTSYSLASTLRTDDRFDTGMAVDLVIERRHAHQAVEPADVQVHAKLEERAETFADADRWSSWRWNPAGGCRVYLEPDGGEAARQTRSAAGLPASCGQSQTRRVGLKWRMLGHLCR